MTPAPCEVKFDRSALIGLAVASAVSDELIILHTLVDIAKTYELTDDDLTEMRRSLERIRYKADVLRRWAQFRGVRPICVSAEVIVLAGS